MTDGFLPGDRFELFSNGTSLGLTSAPGAGATCFNHITACLGNSAISNGVFALGVGDHAITGPVAASPHVGGAGALLAKVAAVSLPAGAVLLGSVLLGPGGTAARRRHVSV